MRYRKPFTPLPRKIGKKKTVWYYRTYDNEENRTTARSTGQTSKTAARAYCDRLRMDGKLIANQALLFSDYVKDWFHYDQCPYIRGILAREGTYSRNNAKIQRGYIDNCILPALDKHPSNRITPGMIEKWLFSLKEEKGLSAVSVNHNLRTLTTIYKEAVRTGVIDDSPVALVKPLRDDSRVKGILHLQRSKSSSPKAFKLPYGKTLPSTPPICWPLAPVYALESFKPSRRRYPFRLHPHPLFFPTGRLRTQGDQDRLYP